MSSRSLVLALTLLLTSSPTWADILGSTYGVSSTNTPAQNDIALAALSAAILAQSGTGTDVDLPSGIISFTTWSLNGISYARIHGSASGPAGTILQSSGTGITASNTVRILLQRIKLYAASGATGWLLNLSGASSFKISDSQLNGASTGVSGINADQAVNTIISAVAFDHLNHPIDGQATGGHSYSNILTVLDGSSFYANTGYAFNNPGIQWAMRDSYVEPSPDGGLRVATSDSTVTFSGLTFDNIGVYDGTIITNELSLGPGFNLNIHGGYWGGGLLSSTLLWATGPIQGLTLEGVDLQFFTTALAPQVTGSSGWVVQGNQFFAVPTRLANRQFVCNLIESGNSP